MVPVPILTVGVMAEGQKAKDSKLVLANCSQRCVHVTAVLQHHSQLFPSRDFTNSQFNIAGAKLFLRCLKTPPVPLSSVII